MEVANIEGITHRLARFLSQLHNLELADQVGGGIFKGRVKNIEQGLKAMFVDIGLEKNAFIDKLTGCEEPASQAPISMGAETDRIYRLPDGPIELRDPILRRTITIEHAGATSAVVWNPWIEKSARLDDMGPADAYRGMVCIETGNVMPDQVCLLDV